MTAKVENVSEDCSRSGAEAASAERKAEPKHK